MSRHLAAAARQERQASKQASMHIVPKSVNTPQKESIESRARTTTIWLVAFLCANKS
jgi:hypothetical protein